VRLWRLIVRAVVSVLPRLVRALLDYVLAPQLDVAGFYLTLVTGADVVSIEIQRELHDRRCSGNWSCTRTTMYATWLAGCWLMDVVVVW
jgi:hypothetical protein